jgi:hypothetical protein
MRIDDFRAEPLVLLQLRMDPEYTVIGQSRGESGRWR